MQQTTNKLVIALSLVAAVLLSPLSVARADAPPLPCRVYGELPGSATGTVVSALVGGVEYAASAGFADDGRTVYVLDVPGDDPSTPAIEGATDGATIAFRLDGVDVAEVSTWSSGTALSRDLGPLPGGGPVANDLALVGLEDVPLDIELSAQYSGQDTLTYQIIASPANGQLTGTPPNIIFTPDADWNGADSLTFEVSDGAINDIGTVSLSIDPVPDPPRFEPFGNLSLDAGTSLDVPVVAIDPDGHVITLTSFGLPAFATFTETGNGTATLSLAPGFGDVGTYGGRITATDGPYTDEIIFSITVLDVTGPPSAIDQAVSTPEDTATAITLTATDPDGDPISYAVDQAPSFGTLNGTPPDLTYTPNADFFGVDSLTFTASDASGTSLPATVTITVEPTADAPVLGALGDLVINEGENVEVVVAASDADGDAVQLSATGLPSFASFTDLGDGSGRVDLAPGFADAGAYPGIEVTADDGTLTDTASFDLTVIEFAAPPVAAFRVADELNTAQIDDATVEAYSSHLGGFVPERAIDGHTNTNWRTDANGPEWMRVRLSDERAHVVDRVVLRGRSTNSGLRNFEIRVAEESGAFTTVLSAELPQSNDDHVFSFAPTRARWVELHMLDNWGNGSAIDVYVFEVLSREREGGNVSLEAGGAVIADFSTERQDPERALDLNDFSRWESANGNGTDQWITVDLGASIVVDAVRLVGTSLDSSPRDFEIRVSNTGLAPGDFTTVTATTLPEGGDPHHFFFAPTEARYVQLYVIDTHGSFGWVGVGSFHVISPERGAPTVPFDSHAEDADGQVVAWSWDFGDGVTSTESHPVHTYGSPGTYDVTLTVTDNEGQIDSITRPYTVLAPPVAAFSWTPQPSVDEGDLVRFSDLSTSSTAILAWRWTFHEGSVRTSDDPTWSYDDNGSFPVTLEVTDGRGITGTLTQVIDVANLPPSINLIPGPSTVWGEAWQLGQASTTDPGSADHPHLDCHWDFGDGQILDVPSCYGTEARIEHTYALPGSYTATLSATDDDGGSAEASFVAEVALRPSRVNVLETEVVNDALEVRIRLIDDWDFGLPLDGRTVTVRRGAEQVDVVTDANGEATATLTLAIGDPIEVAFAGDALYLPDLGRQLPVGTVLAGVGDGIVHAYTPDGTLIERYDTGSDSLEQTGMCLDPSGTLYTTNFLTLATDSSSMSQFDVWGNRLESNWVGPLAAKPESCVLDPAGNVWVGHVDPDPGEPTLRQYGPDGTLLVSYTPDEENRGVDWIDMAADGCTLLYTSEGTRVLQFDVCTGQQLADFATGLESPLYALRLRENGELMVASSDILYRLDASGQIIQTYFGGSADFFALNLDPDGTTFWTAAYGLGLIYHVDIATGDVLGTFIAEPTPFALSGLAIIGEPTAASNRQPDADAGVDQTVVLSATVALDASASSDPDGDSLSYAWVQTGGSAVILDDNTIATPTFVADQLGTLVFEVTVSDGARSDTDSVTITVEPAPTGCELYPISFHWSLVDGVNLGGELVDVPLGDTQSDFTWLTWDGDHGLASLIAALTPPGTSGLYQNPLDPTDSVVSHDDWVSARDDLAVDAGLQSALDSLIGVDLRVPVWSETYDADGYLKVRVGGFVLIRITGYDLTGADTISFTFHGWETCPTP
ncbi:MAG: PKD domain-containing protein [Acidobacteriota bacterium]